MSKFLDTQQISSELLQMIKEAKERVILVSPYLKVNTQIQERLRTKSKIGTLSEISIIYGKSELQASELEWMSEVEDLKVFEKPNLHAKCYMNESKAIICSMNLYDYSQQNNIEMGVLITRKDDFEAYEQMMDEINNLKINGVRHSFDSIKKVKTDTKVSNLTTDFSLRGLLKIQVLKTYRYEKSRQQHLKAYNIFTNEQMFEIIKKEKVSWYDLKNILTQKQFNHYGNEILSQLDYSEKFTIGTVTNTWYPTDESNYERVKLLDEETQEEAWFDTVKELPKKNKIVAVVLNKNWFNEYFYLENDLQHNI